MFSTDRLWIQPSSSPANHIQIIDYCIFAEKTIAGIFKNCFLLLFLHVIPIMTGLSFKLSCHPAMLKTVSGPESTCSNSVVAFFLLGDNTSFFKLQYIMFDRSFKVPKNKAFYGVLTDLSNFFTQSHTLSILISAQCMHQFLMRISAHASVPYTYAAQHIWSDLCSVHALVSDVNAKCTHQFTQIWK